MKKFVLFFLFVLYFHSVFSQDLQNDLHLDSLILKLYESLNVQKDIEVSEIKGVYKLTPWHFVPSVNYDFISNRYYLTISSSAFVSNMISKRQEKRRLSSIERRYDNLEKSSEIKLKSLYFQLLQRITDLRLSYEILLNDIDIFKIKHQEFANNEIDTETFLTSKSSILNKIKSHNTSVSDVQRFLFDIEQLTESYLNLDFTSLLVSTEAININ